MQQMLSSANLSFFHTSGLSDYSNHGHEKTIIHKPFTKHIIRFCATAKIGVGNY